VNGAQSVAADVEQCAEHNNSLSVTYSATEYIRMNVILCVFITSTLPTMVSAQYVNQRMLTWVLRTEMDDKLRISDERFFFNNS